MKKNIIFLLLFIIIAVIVYISYQVYNKDMLVSIDDTIPPNDPALKVADIFKSMSRGEIDHAKIIYGKSQQPLPVIHSGTERFNGVKFHVENLRLSNYDPNTKSVSYSCRVPHPAVVFWQYVPIEVAELRYVPKGIEMHGQFFLVKEENVGFKVKVTNDSNPISLYNKVVSSVNRMWYMNATTKLSPESINFNVLMLIAAYRNALNIPEEDSKEFAEEMIKEFNKVLPK